MLSPMLGRIPASQRVIKHVPTSRSQSARCSSERGCTARLTLTGRGGGGGGGGGRDLQLALRLLASLLHSTFSCSPFNSLGSRRRGSLHYPPQAESCFEESCFELVSILRAVVSEGFQNALRSLCLVRALQWLHNVAPLS